MKPTQHPHATQLPLQSPPADLVEDGDNVEAFSDQPIKVRTFRSQAERIARKHAKKISNKHHREFRKAERVVPHISKLVADIVNLIESQLQAHVSLSNLKYREFTEEMLLNQTS